MYQLEPIENLVAPALIVAFQGWVNAGSVGTEACDHIAADGDVVATFDPDALFDYRSNRPVINFVNGRLQDVNWPYLSLRRARYERRDVLVLSGNEPDWQWKALGRSVAEIASNLGVVEVVSLGGVPAATPHTYPTNLLTTASRPDMIGESEQLPQGLLRVPGAAVNIVELALTDTGIPAVGFWAQVPHYVAGTYYAGAVALVDRVARHLGITVELGDLVDRVAEQRQQLDATVASQPDSRAYLERLETIAAAQGEIPSADDIAAQVERFLQDAAEGEEPFDSSG
ncbi:MAG TPA: PAC2 family protein [Acidimicrobiia bacterium]|nr:PAC2 family protein [Acidimicrobiia bacterium]